MNGFKDHFSVGSTGYAAHRPVYPPELVGVLASLCPSTATAWDVGCGTGQLSLLLAGPFERVIATDASAAQIASATPHPRVQYVVAPAEKSGIDGGSVDLIVAAQAAHWFDLPEFYREVRRVARPGAVASLVCYEKCVIDGGPIDAVVERVYSSVLGPYWPLERRHVEAGYRDLPFPFEELPSSSLPAMEMRTEWTAVSLVGYVGTWSAVRAAEKAGVTGVLEAFAKDLDSVWGDGGVKRLVRWPLSLRVGRV